MKTTIMIMVIIMNSDQIFGIVMITLIIGSCIYSINHTKKIKQELNRNMNEKPEQKEKIKVIKSLSSSLGENNKNGKYVLAFLIAIFFLNFSYSFNIR